METKFLCSYCNEEFSEISHMNSHLYTHESSAAGEVLQEGVTVKQDQCEPDDDLASAFDVFFHPTVGNREDDLQAIEMRFSGNAHENGKNSVTLTAGAIENELQAEDACIGNRSLLSSNGVGTGVNALQPVTCNDALSSWKPKQTSEVSRYSLRSSRPTKRKLPPKAEKLQGLTKDQDYVKLRDHNSLSSRCTAKKKVRRGRASYKSNNCDQVTQNKRGMTEHDEGGHGEACIACKTCGELLTPGSLKKRHACAQKSTQASIKEIADVQSAGEQVSDGLSCSDEGETEKRGREITHNTQHDNASADALKDASILNSAARAGCGAKYACLESYCSVVRTQKTGQKNRSTSTRYRCNRCSYVTSEKRSMKQHYEGVHIHVRAPCLTCGKFVKAAPYNQHACVPRASKKELVVIKSEVEIVGEDENQDFRAIGMTENRKVVYGCNVCPYRSQYKAMIDRHCRNLHKGVRAFQCDLCDAAYKEKRSLIKHRVKWHGYEMPEKKVKKSLGKDLKCKNEKKTYSRGGERICKICNKNFQCPKQLSEHMNIHEGKRPYECDFCDKSFTHKYYLLSHRRTHTRHPSVTCSVCQKPFCSPHSLRQHMNTHTGERPFACEYCGHAFACAWNLTVHKRIHTDDKPYQCGTCSYSCRQASDIKKHIIAVHTGTYDFCCNICDRKFKFQKRLDDHILRHKKELRHFCNVCGKGFVFTAGLREHRRLHTNDRRYKCTHCGQAYLRSTHLNRHIRSRHPDAE